MTAPIDNNNNKNGQETPTTLAGNNGPGVEGIASNGTLPRKARTTCCGKARTPP